MLATANASVKLERASGAIGTSPGTQGLRDRTQGLQLLDSVSEPWDTKGTLWDTYLCREPEASRIGSAVLHLCRLEPQGLRGRNQGTFVVFLAHVMFGSCNTRSALPSYICAACLIAHVVPLYILGPGGIEFGHLPIIFFQHLPLFDTSFP